MIKKIRSHAAIKLWNAIDIHRVTFKEFFWHWTLSALYGFPRKDAKKE